MQLDILFIHSNASEEIYQGLSKEHSGIETPIWAGMLAQHCRMKGYGVQILDCEAERLNYKEATNLIVEANPRIACFVVYGQQPSASSQNMKGAIALAQELKKISHIKILFVGGHVSALPYEVLQEDCVDLICQNEGIKTISNLLMCDNFNDTSLLEKIKGLGFKYNDGKTTYHLNQIDPIIPQDKLQEELPGIAWDLLPSPTKYRTAGWHSWPNNSIKSPFASIYTSLGCPFKCLFCMINIINREDNSPDATSNKSANFRYWEPEFTINKLDKLANMGIRNLKIADEMFILREQHFMKLCELISERKYNFNIWCYGRVDCTKLKYLEALKKAGVNWIALGIESPNQTVRKDVIKGGYKEVKIKDVVNEIRNAGINVCANYIFGLPEDNLQTMQETLDFAMDLNTENANFYATQAYPGSPLYYQAKTNGWKLPDKYEGYSQHSYWTQNLPSKYLSAAEILKFRDQAWIKYFTNITYLNMLEKKFGIAARNDVENSTKINLKRKILND